MSKTSDVNSVASKGQAGADPYSVPLDAIDVSDPDNPTVCDTEAISNVVSVEGITTDGGHAYVMHSGGNELEVYSLS